MERAFAIMLAEQSAPVAAMQWACARSHRTTHPLPHPPSLACNGPTSPRQPRRASPISSTGGAWCPIDLLARSEEPPVTQVCEPTEVVGALVHLLHERGVRIHQPPNLQHAVDLSRTLPGIEDSLENAFCRDRVEAAVLEGQVVR